MDNIQASLKKFVDYWSKLKGDEKGEAQVFCDRFFQAFGHDGYKEAGASLEERVKRKGRSTRFADLVWKPKLLLEMKKRGQNLENHKEQAFDYWKDLVPQRPRYVALCNFDEFWIYDFDIQIDEPVDKVKIEKLPEQYSSLNFMLPEEKEPIFRNNQVAVAREAANQVAMVFNLLVSRGEPPERAQRFILQCVLSMFSEDFGLLPRDFFTEMLLKCLKGESAYDLLGGLFRQMNNPEQARGGKFKDIPYFNGGLFQVIDPIELQKDEIQLLYDCAIEKWEKVKPEVFGTLFQASMNQKERHALGAHFTSEADILKIVEPVIIRPWKERISKSDTLKELINLRTKITQFKVLDSACGSGNFLYIAFRALRKLELEILKKIYANFKDKSLSKKVGRSLLVTPKQFYGIDINPFAVELARVTMMIGKEKSLNTDVLYKDSSELSDIDFGKLPLDNLNDNIKCEDALLVDWPEADAIIGNPPYQSKNKMQQEFGVDYVKKLRNAYPDIPGRADYCVYWFRKAHDSLKNNKYAGLVGTNTIRQNYSREGGLDYITSNGGEITEAVSSQVWSGDAVVHVSIVNWKKGKVKGKKKIYNQIGHKYNAPWEIFEVDKINSSLSPKIDVSRAKVIQANKKIKVSFQGQTHGHKDFLLNIAEYKEVLGKSAKNKEVIFPYLGGNELIANMNSQPKRYVIDFSPQTIVESSQYKELFGILQRTVLVDREHKMELEKKRNEKVLAENPKAKVNRHHLNFYNKWWLLSYPREDMLENIQSLSRYIACSRVTKRQIFEFIDSDIRPNDSLQIFTFEDDYSFGILNSTLHWEWFKARCSSLKGDYRYTTETVFSTFPWPQNPKPENIQLVATEAVNFRKARKKLLTENNCTLRDLYRTVDLPGKNPLKDVQNRLDQAVRKAYNCGKEDELTFLLRLNLEITGKEQREEAVTPPGLPDWIDDKEKFVTEDCVKYED